MKYEELKKSLEKNIEPAYLLHGTDFFLLNHALSLIEKSCNIEIKEFNYQKFSDKFDMDILLSALNTLPINDSKKMIYLDLTSLNKIPTLNLLYDYLKAPNESTCLVINIGANISVEDFKASITVVNCNKIEKSIAYKFLRKQFLKYNKTIKQDALDMFYNYTLGDLSVAQYEIIKIVNFIGDKEQIEIEDIIQITNEIIDFQVFDLTNNLARKNSKEVFRICSCLKKSKEGYKNILNLLYSHFRRLFYVSILNDLKNAELSKMLGVKEYAVIQYKNQAKQFTKRQLKSIVELCNISDYNTKTSNSSIDGAVELIILKILNM